MCGIIGYTGTGDATRRVVEGLTALEYRGYDSAGVAAFDGGKIKTVKSKGRVALVAQALINEGLRSTCAIGHTRWATHGAPSDVNSHPHTVGETTLVHNGIIENHAEIRKKFSISTVSETDTEVAAALINLYRADNKDILSAIRGALKETRGSYAFGIMFDGRDGEIYAAKKDSPLVIGLADDGNFIASDVTAILAYTKDYIPLSDGDIAKITPDGYEIFDSRGNAVERQILRAAWDAAEARRGGFSHFMLKEINEEPSAVKKTVAPRLRGGAVDFSGDGISDEELKNINRLTVVACGTAYHAGLMARYYIERLCRVRVDVKVASEFRYEDPIIDSSDVVLLISQSGETADTLAALRLSKERGARTLALVNVIGSTAAREASGVIYTYAGPEIAVASTKAYTVQSATLAAFALRMAYAKGLLPIERLCDMSSQLAKALPAAISDVISREAGIKAVAGKYCTAENMFFIGRGADAFAAYEASLKLKEISYIHSEAYPAGELKHGTISLITPATPTIAIATRAALFDKMMNGVREVAARGGEVAAFCAPEFPRDAAIGARFELPECDEFISPIVAGTACQLFAYHTAVFRGCDVDKPRNLAKSVTVE